MYMQRSSMDSAQQTEHRYTHFLEHPGDAQIVSDVDDHSLTTLSRQTRLPVSASSDFRDKTQLLSV